MFKEAPSPSPATHEGQEALRVLFEAGRAESAEMKAKLDAILAAVSPKASAAPLSSAEQAAKEGAVVGLVSDPQPAAQEAARDLASGDVTAGFDALEREARAAEASAAEKWQRLGALAAGVDTARAHAAYEQAFRLDPTDFWTCVMLARLRQQAGDLRAAGEAARAAKQAVRTDRERYVANFWVGDVLVKAGDLAGARAHLEKGLTIAERLAAQNPGSAEAQRDVSVSLNKLGDVLAEGGDLAGARARFEQCHAVLERLAAQNPGSAEAQRDVSVSLNKLGNVLVKAGDLAGARKRFEEDLAIAERLAAQNPGSA
ncbi:MAG: tetratricopeptide repeat protein, partial [Rhodospirillales bacterium]|nr:tetratricopeptide repeat protein [Rhodospirillales bacterium]